MEREKVKATADYASICSRELRESRAQEKLFLSSRKS